MAETLKAIATSSAKLPSLVISNGQLIFVQDTHKIALDFNNKRVFYNQITELDTEEERSSLEEPDTGFYFVISTAVLWRYDDGWEQITSSPQEVLFIGVEMPEFGSGDVLYIDKQEGVISVWDDDLNDYIVVANKTVEISSEEIAELF